MAEQVLLTANSGISLPTDFHTATGEVQGLKVEAKSQCEQRANALVGAFTNTLPEEGFQAASNATHRAMEFAVADKCAAEVRVFRPA